MSLNATSARMRRRSSSQNDDNDVLTFTAPVVEAEIVADSVERCTRSGFRPTFQDTRTPPATRNSISGL